MTIAGHSRPLDDLTLKLMVERLDYRRHQWPSTTNLHLLINNQPANTTSRASNHCHQCSAAGTTPLWRTIDGGSPALFSVIGPGAAATRPSPPAQSRTGARR